MATWSVCYDEPHQPGEPRKRVVKSGFRTRKEASDWFTKRAEEIRQGISTADDRQTIEQYLKQWLEATADSVSASALHAYRNHVEAHIIPALGTVRLTELRPKHIEKAKARWASEPAGRRKKKVPLSSRTVHHVFSTLRTALKRALRQRAIAWNPCDGVEPPRVERKEMHALDAVAAAALVKACEQGSVGAAIVTSLGTGLRRGELLALRWGDVDLKADTLTVQRAIERADRQSRFKEPKTKALAANDQPPALRGRPAALASRAAGAIVLGKWPRSHECRDVSLRTRRQAVGAEYFQHCVRARTVRRRHRARAPTRSPAFVRLDGARGRCRPQDSFERARTFDNLDDS